MYQRAIQQSTGDEHFAQYLALTIEREEVKLFYLKIAQPVAQQMNYIFRFPDAGDWGPLLPCRTDSQFQSRNQPPCLGWTDTRRPQQFSGGTPRQPAEGAFAGLHELPGQLQDIMPAPART
jgi:hypothetical protein